MIKAPSCPHVVCIHAQVDVRRWSASLEMLIPVEDENEVGHANVRIQLRPESLVIQTKLEMRIHSAFYALCYYFRGDRYQQRTYHMLIVVEGEICPGGCPISLWPGSGSIRSTNLPDLAISCRFYRPSSSWKVNAVCSHLALTYHPKTFHARSAVPPSGYTFEKGKWEEVYMC